MPDAADYGIDYLDRWGRGPLLAYFQDSCGMPPHIPSLDVTWPSSFRPDGPDRQQMRLDAAAREVAELRRRVARLENGKGNKGYK